jgi:hypothetical protein
MIACKRRGSKDSLGNTQRAEVRKDLFWRVAWGTPTNLRKLAKIALDMQNIIGRITLIAALTFLSGCNPSPNPALTGTWLFTLTSSGSPAEVIQLTANLTQLGNAITGQVTLSGNGAACGTTASMSGTVKGNNLTLQLVQQESTIEFTGTANQAFTSASGTYTATAGTCLQNGSGGSWSATLE